MAVGAANDSLVTGHDDTGRSEDTQVRLVPAVVPGDAVPEAAMPQETEAATAHQEPPSAALSQRDRATDKDERGETD